MKNEVMKVFNTYTEALSKGDFGEVFKTISDGIVWHMGGESSLSGVIVGKQALGERLSEFTERGEEKLKNPGIDLFRIENGKIQEVWTFGELQEEEDRFWE